MVTIGMAAQNKATALPRLFLIKTNKQRRVAANPRMESVRSARCSSPIGGVNQRSAK